jgi:hypothetical protein
MSFTIIVTTASSPGGRTSLPASINCWSVFEWWICPHSRMLLIGRLFFDAALVVFRLPSFASPRFRRTCYGISGPFL